MSQDIDEPFNSSVDWLPFESDDLPSDDEPQTDIDLPSDDEPDVLPQIEETPVEEKKPKGKAAPQAEKFSSSKGTPARDADEDMISRYLDKQETKSKGKPPTFPAPKKGGRKSKAMTQEEVARHMILVLKIDKYRTSERYSECLARSRLPLQDADNMTIEELEALLTRIGIVINNRHSGGGGMLSTGILMGASVAEKAAFMKRFANLDGYSASLSNNAEFQDLCEQISIEYSIMDNLRPETRLAICLGKQAMLVNGMNKMKADMASQQAPPVPAPDIAGLPDMVYNS